MSVLSFHVFLRCISGKRITNIPMRINYRSFAFVNFVSINMEHGTSVTV